MTTLSNILKITIIKSYMTNTTTTTTTNTENNNNKKPDDINDIKVSQESQTPEIKPTTLSDSDLSEKLEANRKIYEDILKEKPYTIDYIEEQIQKQKVSVIEKSDKINDTVIPSSEDSNKFYENLREEIQDPEIVLSDNNAIATDVEKTIIVIKTGCNMLGEVITEKCKANEIALEESEQAEIRQQALYHRISEFVASFNLTKTAVKIGFGLAITYTIYNIIRYRQIPLGGFLKGLVTSNDNTIPNIIPSTSNITITMPSIDTIKQSIPNPIPSNTLGAFIDNIGPTGMLFIGGVVWILRKLK